MMPLHDGAAAAEGISFQPFRLLFHFSAFHFAHYWLTASHFIELLPLRHYRLFCNNVEP